MKVDNFSAGDYGAMYNQLMIDVAKKYPDQILQFARFAAREVAVRFCPHEEVPCRIEGGNTH